MTNSDDMQIETVSDALLELMAARGIEYFFAGGTGTDFPPIVEAFAKRVAHNKKKPIPIAVAHEITTMGMAHGVAMVTGKPQFAMVHTTVGTANAMGGVINASRARVPVYLAAGRSSITEKGHRTSRSHGVHWAQEARDQAGMMREYVKWDYELRRPEQLETVFDRGLSLAESAPQSPVYLTLPLEVVASEIKDFKFSAEPRLKPSAPTRPCDEALQKAAKVLGQARQPVIIVTAMGRDKQAVPALVQFAEKLGIPVIEHWHTYMNFPQDHPLHLGFDAKPYLQDADVVVTIESDAPWFPRTFAPPENATIIQIDEDPLYERYPIRGFATDIGLQGNPRCTLEALVEVLSGESLNDKEIAARRERYRSEHDKQRAQWKQDAKALANKAPMDPKWVSHCIAEQMNVDDIAVTEYQLDPTQTCFTEPGTFFNHSHAGGLGWGPGAALGAKLAKPEATVFCAVGDGCHMFGVPSATHFMSRAQNLPVVYVILNNGLWGKSRLAAFDYAPDGWAAKLDKEGDGVPIISISPSLDFEKICEAAGGYGERVEDPQDLPAAMARAVKAVKEEGRQACLNVICQP